MPFPEEENILPQRAIPAQVDHIRPLRNPDNAIGGVDGVEVVRRLAELAELDPVVEQIPQVPLRPRFEFRPFRAAVNGGLVYPNVELRNVGPRPIRTNNELEEEVCSDEEETRKSKHLCVSCGEDTSISSKEKYMLTPSKLQRYKVICDKCVSKFAVCSSCGYHFKPEELELEHCVKCISEAPKRYIKRYSYRVEDDFGMRHGAVSAETYSSGKPKDEIYYGVELELESEKLGLDVIRVNALVKDFAYLKSDSSIKSGFEIVSAPATMEEHYHMWDNFFEKLPPTSRPLKSCGMHVHASRGRMSDLQIAKILVFLHSEKNREFVKLIAGRESSFHNNFETKKSFRDVKKLTYDKHGRPDHHTALNLHKEQTIEFRIFWATRDKRIFFKNLEFVKAIIKFSDWAHTSMKDIEWRKFVEFARAYRKDYEYLCLFFETPSMKKLLGE